MEKQSNGKFSNNHLRLHTSIVLDLMNSCTVIESHSDEALIKYSGCWYLIKLSNEACIIEVNRKGRTHTRH
jgi:hypothetical protein